ncbi:MAG: lipopolysaccharide biosynthesis protein [Candidatus Limnocylindria bacterium]
MLSSPKGRRPARLARSAAIYGTAGVLGKAAALLAVPYLTRQLGPEQYGLVDLATSFSGLLVIVVRFAGDMPTMRLAAHLDSDGRQRAHSAFVGGTIITSVLAVAMLVPTAGLVAAGLWDSPDSGGLAMAAMFLIPVNAVQTAFANVLRFAERPKTFAVVAVIDLVAQLALAVVLVAAGFGPLGVVLGYILGGLIGLGATAVAARHHLSRTFDFGLARRLIREGLPFLPGVIAFIFADTVARTIAANTIGIGAVGQLGLAIRIASVITLASGAFSSAWGPYGFALTPSPATRNLLSRVAFVMVTIVSVAAVGAGAVAPELSVIVGGSQFLEASHAIPGLLLSGGLTAWVYVLTTAAGIAHRGQWVAWAAVLGAIVQIGAISFLIPTLGISGFAIGSVLGRLASVAMLGWAVSETAPTSPGGVAVVALAVTGTFVTQALNVSPAETLLPRLMLAAGAAVVGVVILARTVAHLGPVSTSTGKDSLPQ